MKIKIEIFYEKSVNNSLYVRHSKKKIRIAYDGTKEIVYYIYFWKPSHILLCIKRGVW